MGLPDTACDEAYDVSHGMPVYVIVHELIISGQTTI